MAVSSGSLILDALLIVLTLVFVTYKYVTRNYDYWKVKGVPYVKPEPLFGNFKDVATLKVTIGHWLANFYNKQKHDYFGIWVFGTPHLVIKSPELVKKILVKDFNYFHDRTLFCDEEIDPMASKTIFLMKNPEWKSFRVKLSPIFTSGKIKSMIPLMNEAAEELKAHLFKESRGGQVLEVKEIIAKFTTDVITSCAFGVQAQSFQHEDAAFRNVGRMMFDFNLKNAVRNISYFLVPDIVKLFKMNFFDPRVNKFLRGAFWDTINQREKLKNKRNDLIDMLIEMKNVGGFDGIKFEGDTVVGQALQFFAAGFETTSSAIAFTLYELCLQPNLQDNARAEILKVLNNNNDVTFEAVNSLKFLDKCVKETLRKYPVLPFLDRRCVKDYKIEGSDYVIEKGTPVYIPMFGLHYDPEYFPDPEKYDPERFSEANVNSRPSYSYIPFGDGPHNCIGERFGLIVTKLGLVHVLSNFKLERSKETPVPIVFDTRTFILQSTIGLPMKVTPIKA